MINKPIRSIAAAFCALTLLLAAVGCSDSRNGMNARISSVDDAHVPKSRINLTLWGASEDRAMLRQQCDRFCRDYTDADITVTIRAKDEDAACDAAIDNNKTAADVFAVKNSRLGQLVSAEAVSENTFFADDVTSRLTDEHLTAASVNRKLYGYPFSSDTCVLYYDKSKLGSSDIGSLERIADKVKIGSKRTSGVCPFAADLDRTELSSGVFLTAGNDPDRVRTYYYNDIDPNSDSSISAARYIAALGDLGMQDMDAKTAAARFKAGTLASYAATAGVADIMSRALGDNYGVAELPTIRLGGEDRHLMSFSDGYMYVVKSSTAHPREAAALANYLTSDMAQLDRFGKRGLLPISSGLTDDPSLAGSPMAQAMLGQMRYSIPTPAAAVSGGLWDSIASLGRELFGGKINDEDIKNRLSELTAEIKTDLDLPNTDKTTSYNNSAADTVQSTAHTTADSTTQSTTHTTAHNTTHTSKKIK